MKGTVITYCEASKKYPNAIDNIVMPKKKRQRTTKTIELNSSEFPMKPWVVFGLHQPWSRFWQERRDLKAGRGDPLRT